MSKRGQVIALVTSKGGSGKTTLAVSIAAELLARGERVTLIDADPQGSGGLAHWHGSGEALSKAELIVDATERAAATARQAATQGTVVVDVGGAFTRTVAAIIEAADIILVPCRPSGLDAARALEIVEAAQASSQAKVTVVMNGVTRSAMSPHIRKELKAAGAKVLRSEVGQRVGFATAMLYGSAPALMGASKANDEIKALVNEIRRL